MTDSDKWLVCKKTSSSRSLRLFCFPSAGGGTILFRSWRRELPETMQVCPVKLPGREDRIREPLITDLSEMTEKLLEGLTPYLNGSFVFFGHSMGALIAFELTRKLRKRELPMPEHLFVSACPAPQEFTDPYRFSRLHTMDESSLIRELRKIGGTPEAVLNHPELLAILIPIVRADFKAVETYTYIPSPPLNCPVTVFGGTEDPRISDKLTRAWQKCTTNLFQQHWLPGGHFFIESGRQRKQMFSIMTEGCMGIKSPAVSVHS